MSPPDSNTAPRGQLSVLVDAADQLFHENGITATTMQAIREKASVSEQDVASLFDTKDQLVEAVLDDRHDTWMNQLQGSYSHVDDPRDKILTIFNHLEHSFATGGPPESACEEGYGELRPGDHWVAAMRNRHVLEFSALVEDLAEQAELPRMIGSSIALLAEGAQTTAAATHSVAPARDGRAAAAMLIALHQTDPTADAF